MGFILLVPLGQAKLPLLQCTEEVNEMDNKLLTAVNLSVRDERIMQVPVNHQVCLDFARFLGLSTSGS